jgi:UTP-glucose-1-phosphate uridylyltransferase
MKEITHAGGKSVTFIVSNERTKEAFQSCFQKEIDIEAKFKRTNNTVMLELLQNIYLPEEIDIKYIIQNEPKGLGHAIGLAANANPKKHLAVILPDDIIIPNGGGNVVKQVIDEYLKNQMGGNMFLTMEVKDTSRYGIIENGIFREKPKETTSNEASIKFFILDKEVAKELGASALRAENPEAEEYSTWETTKKELHYSDYLNKKIEEMGEHMKIKTCKIDSDDLYLDCGTIKGYEKALLYSLLEESIFKDENEQFIKRLLSKK